MLHLALALALAASDGSVDFAAVGDIQMGRAWAGDKVRIPPNAGAGFFDGVAEPLRTAELAVGNLETVIADGGDSHKCDRRLPPCYAYRVPTVFATRVAEAGFDMLSLANNHAGDFGTRGVESTMHALDGVGVRYSGPDGVVAHSEVNGTRVAFVAFSYGKNWLTLRDVKAARRLVRELAADGSIVVVSFHGGAEGREARHVVHGIERYRGEFRGNLRVFTHAVVDAGADLVIGHGPHVLRAAEVYRGRLIAYSLGNFSSYRSLSIGGVMGISCILKARLAADGALVSADIVPVHLPKPGLPQLDTSGRAIAVIRSLSRADFGDAVFDSGGHYSRPVLAER